MHDRVAGRGPGRPSGWGSQFARRAIIIFPGERVVVISSGRIRIVDAPGQAINFPPQRIVDDPGLPRIRHLDHMNIVMRSTMVRHVESEGSMPVMPRVQPSPGIGADGTEIAARIHA